MLETAKHYAENCTAILGFRDAAHVILDEDFDACGCDVRLATDDGSKGHHGFVTDLLRQRLEEGGADIIYAAVPRECFRRWRHCPRNSVCAVKFRWKSGWPAASVPVWGCATPIRTADGGMTYKHVCKDGPVFDAKEVIF